MAARSNRQATLTATFAALLLAAAAVSAAPRGSEPRATVAEPVYDAGMVIKGKEIRHDFEIRNEGPAPLKITEVKPACGCTVADYDATIAPGGTGKVRAVVETESFRGPIAKSISVFTNDPENPRLNLVVKALVRTHVQVQPVYARFMTVTGEGAEPTVHRVWSEDRSQLAVVRVESPYPFLEAREVEVGDGGEAGGRQWEVRLTLAADAPVGPLADRVRVITDHPDQKVVEIPVSGLVRPVLAAIPPVAELGRRELDQPFQASLEVRNYSAEEIELTGVDSSVRGVRAELKPLRAGKVYQLQLTLDPAMPKGDFAGTLTIHSSSARQPRLEVEVRGSIL